MIGMAAQHAITRKQFGKTLSEFGLIKEKFAFMELVFILFLSFFLSFFSLIFFLFLSFPFFSFLFLSTITKKKDAYALESMVYLTTGMIDRGDKEW